MTNMKKKRKYVRKVPRVLGAKETKKIKDGLLKAANDMAQESRDRKDMTDKEQKAFQVWVEAKFHELLQYFLIDFVSLDFNYADQPPHNGKNNVIFTVGACDNYHQLVINIYPSSFAMFKNGKKNFLIDGMIHELAHYHTNKLGKLAGERFVTQSELRGAVEETTETLAQYIRLYLRGKHKVDIYKK